MKNRPKLIILAVALLVAGAGVFFLIQRRVSHTVLRIGIPRSATHMAVGQTSRLTAYGEYEGGAIDAASASSGHDVQREAVTPKWSVSDPEIASISEDGVLTAHKPGRVTVQSRWENFETSATVEVLKHLPGGVLPRIDARGSRCVPQGASLSLAKDGLLSFQLKFADSGCSDLAIEAKRPEGRLPWAFDQKGARLELKSAQGPVVTGDVTIPGGSEISFTAWSEGDGTYPISLENKTILLTGDSMSEGIGWSMKEKVAAAGGRLIVQPWYSSTTVGWEAEHRMREYMEKYKPDIVFIALGSNEIFTNDSEVRGRAVRGITAEIGDRPAYWIGPPSWKPDHGIVKAIESNFTPDRFYNSNSLVVPRRRDGAHPTVEGYVTWTDLIWDWFARAL